MFGKRDWRDCPPLPSQPRKYTVALVGPPNCGKSTLFNQLTGLRQKVANFPGVTVEKRVGKAKLVGRGEVEIIDLPGIYSLVPRSEDERVTHDVLKGLAPDVNRPDAILLILDSTNFKRHLTLAIPILQLKIPTLVILNMADELESRGGSVDVEALTKELGADAVLVSAAKGQGMEQVFEYLAARTEPPKPVQLPVLQICRSARQWARNVGDKAGYVAPVPSLWSQRIDKVVLHPIAGPAIFLIIVLAVFQAMFSWAKPMMDAIELGVTQSGQWIGALLPAGTWYRSLVVDGVWNGVGSVLVFLPRSCCCFCLWGC